MVVAELGNAGVRVDLEMQLGQRHAGATLAIDLAAMRWNYRFLPAGSDPASVAAA